MLLKFKIPVCIFFSLAVLAFASNRTYAQSKAWVAPSNAVNIKNPLAGNTSILNDAKKLYISTCAPCHGAKGKGDGVAAAALNPKPADHTSEAVQKETDGTLFWMMSQGRNAMPQFKSALTETQRWELVDYIRTLAKKK